MTQIQFRSKKISKFKMIIEFKKNYKLAYDLFLKLKGVYGDNYDTLDAMRIELIPLFRRKNGEDFLRDIADNIEDLESGTISFDEYVKRAS